MRTLDAHELMRYDCASTPPTSARALTAKSSTSTSTKKAVTLSLHGDVLDDARAHGITLSAVLESAALYAIRPARQRRWREENRPAIDA